MDLSHPLISVYRLVSDFSGALAFEASWIDIFYLSKQRPKKEQFPAPRLNHLLHLIEIDGQRETVHWQLFAFALLAA
jgi:hypothetical protein